MRKTYSTDLSDEEWSYIEPHLPAPNAPGRPRLHTLREILDAIFYILRSGCAWRLLPNDFPPWKTIHHYFQDLEARRYLREDARRSAQACAGAYEPRSRAERLRWWIASRLKRPGWAQRSAALSRSQEGQRKKAPPLGGHPGIGARSARPQRENPGPRVGIKLLLEPARTVLRRLSHVWLDAGYTGQDKGACSGWRGRWAGRRRSLGTRPSRHRRR